MQNTFSSNFSLNNFSAVLPYFTHNEIPAPSESADGKAEDFGRKRRMVVKEIFET